MVASHKPIYLSSLCADQCPDMIWSILSHCFDVPMGSIKRESRGTEWEANTVQIVANRLTQDIQEAVEGMGHTIGGQYFYYIGDEKIPEIAKHYGRYHSETLVFTKDRPVSLARVIHESGSRHLIEKLIRAYRVPEGICNAILMNLNNGIADLLEAHGYTVTNEIDLAVEGVVCA